MKELIIKCYEESDGIIPIYQFPKDGMDIPIAGELIRCKDCECWQDKTTYRDYPICVDFGREMKADDFCSKPKRKEA